MSDQTAIVRKMLPASREEVFDAGLDAPVDVPPPGGEFRGDVRTARGRPLSHPSCTHSKQTMITRVSSAYWIGHPSYSSTGCRREQTIKIRSSPVELLERGTQCELVLTHERFLREEAASEHDQGWRQIADEFGGYLAQVRRTKPEDFGLVYKFAAPVEKVYQQFAPPRMVFASCA